ncbi:hypothetical protein Pvag_pPag20137 (plasmid) [Pantoea vagans C9-1]|nr:hypothetical protein Pvag_pPag20137 [Pantoea vagans C9-1]
MNQHADKRYSTPELPVTRLIMGEDGLLRQFRINYMRVILQGDYSQ